MYSNALLFRETICAEGGGLLTLQSRHFCQTQFVFWDSGIRSLIFVALSYLYGVFEVSIDSDILHRTALAHQGTL